MTYLNRLTVDFVSKEQLSDSRLTHLTRELTDYLHVVLVEPEDDVHVEIDKNFNYHVHDNTDGDSYCDFCVRQNAQDRLSGDVLVERSLG